MEQYDHETVVQVPVPEYWYHQSILTRMLLCIQHVMCVLYTCILSTGIHVPVRTRVSWVYNTHISSIATDPAVPVPYLLE